MEEYVTINITQAKEVFESPPFNFFKVPFEVRKLNTMAYMPRVISIGPFHYGKSKFKPMEKYKEMYSKRFKARLQARLRGHIIDNLQLTPESIRGYYAEPIQQELQGSGNFVKMILVDAFFILELFCGSKSIKKISKNDDPIAMIVPLREAMALDLLLFENQLPFFVLEKLFMLDPEQKVPLIQHALDFFKEFDFFNGLINEEKKNLSPQVTIKHLTDLLRCFMLPNSFENLPKEREKNVRLSYSAKQLHEAGVKFEKSGSKCLYDITFEKGVLKIPCLKLSFSTEVLIRNVMALENYSYRTKGYITDYFAMLDLLIDSTQDMDLLCDKGIVNHYLGDKRTATDMVNNLHTNISWEGLNSDYCRICTDLNDFYRKTCNRWMAALRHDYCNTPWRGASTVAAIILLLLTLIQTICSIISVV